VNKVDNHNRLLEASEFYGLGFENIHFISAMSGSGTGDLLDAVIACSKKNTKWMAKKSSCQNLRFIGQPNVGKSSLLNALVGSERTIVSTIAGTTRDTIHTHYNLFNKEFTLIRYSGYTS
jgi:GTP-binding protein